MTDPLAPLSLIERYERARLRFDSAIDHGNASGSRWGKRHFAQRAIAARSEMVQVEAAYRLADPLVFFASCARQAAHAISLVPERIPQDPHALAILLVAHLHLHEVSK